MNILQASIETILTKGQTHVNAKTNNSNKKGKQVCSPTEVHMEDVHTCETQTAYADQVSLSAVGKL